MPRKEGGRTASSTALPLVSSRGRDRTWFGGRSCRKRPFIPHRTIREDAEVAGRALAELPINHHSPEQPILPCCKCVSGCSARHRGRPRDANRFATLPRVLPPF